MGSEATGPSLPRGKNSLLPGLCSCGHSENSVQENLVTRGLEQVRKLSEMASGAGQAPAQESHCERRYLSGQPCLDKMWTDATDGPFVPFLTAFCFTAGIIFLSESR